MNFEERKEKVDGMKLLFTASNGVKMIDFIDMPNGSVCFIFVNPVSLRPLMCIYEENCIGEGKDHTHEQIVKLFYPKEDRFEDKTCVELAEHCHIAINELYEHAINKMKGTITGLVDELFSGLSNKKVGMA